MGFCVTNIEGQPVCKAILTLCADLCDAYAKECKRHNVDYCKQRAQTWVAVLKNNDTHHSLTKLFIFISMFFYVQCIHVPLRNRSVISKASIKFLSYDFLYPQEVTCSFIYPCVKLLYS